ncbi:MAG: hypothetical protein N2561_08080 [Bacteroidetes bacterium]|nr:hypothetical protein [Rhodothermia bacterium]MCS7155435.1 hypothetical protein [Bacteroidota bacterium]MCX7907472.1 hypothetical protein [Bacteroidota bacterium]MDW8138466.1 hypothetical protein [Bacteroidota bacterium]MDW8284597.1 hypothetical protein [Bacteroidota bacterium]
MAQPGWKFSPYHHRIPEALERAQGPLPPSDTEWPVWEVFRQPERGEPHLHVGSVHAPDPQTALVLAKEQFSRREPCVQLWVVRAEAIYATPYEDADIFEPALDRTYRLAAGYKVRPRIRRAQEEEGGQP